MDTTEISLLTRAAIERLLSISDGDADGDSDNCQRAQPRWPFPGTVQFWCPDEQGQDQHNLATCVNLSTGGLGMRCDDPLEVGLRVAMAVHQPEASLHGHGIIRHCTALEEGYFVGVQFDFAKEK